MTGWVGVRVRFDARKKRPWETDKNGSDCAESGFCQIRSGDQFKGKMGDIRANACMFHGKGANLPFSVQIDQGVFVQISGLGHFRFPEFDI